VGKSLSAQHYANWFHLQAYEPYHDDVGGGLCHRRR